MTVADLLTALTELRAGRITVEQLIAACSAWSNEPTRPLADFLKPALAVPLAEPASGVLETFSDRRPTAARRAPATRQAGPNRTWMFIAAGVGLVALIGMGIGLGYLGQTNARLEEANTKLKAANADLESANAELTTAGRPAERVREPKTNVKADSGREPPVTAPTRTGEAPKSIKTLEDAMAKARQAAGPDDPRTLKAAADLGRALVDAGRPAEAIPVLEDVDRRLADPPVGWPAGVALAHALWATGQTDRAIEVAERVQGFLPDDDPLVPEARLQLALAYRAAGKWDRAKSLFLDHLVFARKTHGDQSKQAAEAAGWMGECQLKTGDADGAERLARECLDLRTQQAANDWSTSAAKSLLGEVLLARKKPEQAEPLLKQGYDGLKARKDAIPWDRRTTLADAAGRLAMLYEVTGDKEKSAEWKKVEEQERGKK
jgi:tetratricopeptide (TPR) repeat protein